MDLMRMTSESTRVSVTISMADVLTERASKLQGMVDYIKGNMQALVELNTKTNWVPLAVSRKEVENSVYVIGSYLEYLESDATLRGSFEEPVGVVFAMPAFDAVPMLITIQGLGPWLYGNTVVVRPSKQTEDVYSFYREAMRQLDIRGFHVLSETTGQEFLKTIGSTIDLLRDSGVRKDYPRRGVVVNFSGSEQVWNGVLRHVRDAVVAVFNGPGNATAYVSADADVDDAAKRIALSSFENAGQYCFSLKLILVHKHVYDLFREAYLDYTTLLKVGDPFDEEVVVGPVKNVAVLRLWKKWTRERADRKIYGPDEPEHEEYRGLGRVTFVRPTVFELDHLPEVEMFGSLSALVPVESIEEAMELMKRSPFGLYTAVFGTLEEWEKTTVLAMDGFVGNVTYNHTINDVPEGRQAFTLGWGGFRKSGYIIDRRDGSPIRWGGKHLPHDIACTRSPELVETASGEKRKRQYYLARPQQGVSRIRSTLASQKGSF